MKTSALAILGMLLLTCCTTNVNKTLPEDTMVNESETNTEPAQFCFQRLEGTTGQDTAYLKLIITNNQVSGEFIHIPFEKDARRGTITGTRNGDVIKAVWSFMQEGVKDTMSVAFKLDGDHLLQKNYSIDPQTGRQYTSDTSRFSLEYSKIDCKN